MRPTLKIRALLACAGMLAAQARAEPFVEGVSTRVEALSYRYATDTWQRSPFQRVASQPDHVWSTELRPDFAWRADSADAALRPRLLATSQPGAQHTTSWLNEGWLRWRPADGISLQGGREVLLWGPSMFWNPSNPFFAVSNKDNPKREIAGKDLLRARWQIDRQFALNAISLLGRGHRNVGTQRMDGLKLDWIGNEASAAAIVSAEPGKAPDWQGWAQWTVSDALLLYGELAWRKGAAYALPTPAASPTGWRVESRSGERALQAVLGASYTFENNWVLHAEAWRNGAGLTDHEAEQLASAADALAAQPRGLADQQLGTLIRQSVPLRRHYAGLQLANGDAHRIGWKLRVTRNLDDASLEGVAMLDYDLNDSLKLWLNLMRRRGSSASEYGRWVRSSGMLGVTWYAF